MTCLITGGAGFIGSHLADSLVADGQRVLVIDDLSTGRIENIQHLLDQPNFRFVHASILNEMVLDHLAAQADVIVHLAAAVGVRLIIDQPVHTIATNVMGSEAVLKAALRYRRRILIASTSEVYGKSTHVPFREDDDVVLGPTSRSRWSYAASKMVDEFLALAYHHEEGLPVVLVRLFNTVGPRQTGRYGMVVPRFVGQALRGEPITVYGSGQQSRCFLHVADAVEAMRELLTCKEATGQVYNVGSTEEVTIVDLAHRVLQAVARSQGRPVTADNAQIVCVPYDQAYAPGFEDMAHRVPALDKIRHLTGWQPRRSLEQVLADVITSFEAAPPE